MGVNNRRVMLAGAHGAKGELLCSQECCKLCLVTLGRFAIQRVRLAAGVMCKDPAVSAQVRPWVLVHALLPEGWEREAAGLQRAALLPGPPGFYPNSLASWCRLLSAQHPPKSP